MTTKRNTFLSTGLALGIAALLIALLFSTATPPVAAAGPPVFINEIHYDDSGGDSDEGVEIAGPAGTSLASWQLVPYNGNGGGQYSGTSLSGTIPDQQDGFGTLWFAISGLQNGAPDGIALVNDSGTVIQFLSYEGSFTATDGPANGMTSTDIGVDEQPAPADGNSLQLQGTGNGYDDFTWAEPIAHTRGAVNTGQTFEQSTPKYSISKDAPTLVAPGEVFTYTLTVKNGTGITPTTTTIADVLPTGVDFISASDGGTETGGTVTWAVSNLADGATISRTFVVTATGSHGDALKNANYYVNGGTDWLTTTAGTTVTTQIVGDCNSIYHIQYPGGDSLCTGETVVVTGTVYAVYGSDFALADTAGAWHGLYVDSSSDTPSVGDQIQVEGTVEESNGLTQIAWITHTVSATGTTPYAASVVDSGDIATGGSAAESYESVLVEVHDTTVTNDNLGFGEWSVDDGSGDVRVDDMGSYTYVPTNGDALAVVRGMLNYSYSNYKIEPRDDDDIVPATGSGLLISKDALDRVAPGALLTYTLTVENQTGQLLSPPTVSDTLPLSVTYASSNPAGAWNAASHTITWTAVTSLSHGSTLSYTIVVTAPTAMTTLVNDDYTAQASSWVTVATGSAVETLVRDCNTIYGIQYVDNPGSDDASPCAGETVTVQGIVYATYGSSKYFIADAAAPGTASTCTVAAPPWVTR